MKKIGGNIYIHRSNMGALDNDQTDLVYNALKFLKGSYPLNNGFAIIKIDTKNIAVTFIESEDWDSAREPVVGNAYRVNSDGDVKLLKKKNNPQIYHHKWMFVSENYEGFDIEESKAWSKLWEEKLPKTREVKGKVGYREQWLEILKEYGLGGE